MSGQAGTQSSLLTALQDENLLKEIRRHGQRVLDRRLKDISDDVVDWFADLAAVFEEVIPLAAITDELRWATVFEYTDKIEGCRKEYYVTIAITGHAAYVMRTFDDRAQWLLMKIENACANAIDFMLEEHGTNLRDAYTEQRERLVAAKKLEFELSPFAKYESRPTAPLKQSEKPKRRLIRPSAPWKIST